MSSKEESLGEWELVQFCVQAEGSASILPGFMFVDSLCISEYCLTHFTLKINLGDGDFVS